jgi:hypothetical protein
MSVSVDEREYPVAELDVQGAGSSEFRVASRGKIAKMPQSLPPRHSLRLNWTF